MCFLTINYDASSRFVGDVFFKFRTFPSVFSLPRVFHYEGVCILSNAFSGSIL